MEAVYRKPLSACGSAMRDRWQQTPNQWLETTSNATRWLKRRKRYGKHCYSCCRTPELTHAGPKTVGREAELRRPSGVVCSDFVRHCGHGAGTDSSRDETTRITFTLKVSVLVWPTSMVTRLVLFGGREINASSEPPVIISRGAPG